MEVILTDTVAKAAALEQFLPNYSVRCTFGGLEEFPRTEISVDIERQFKPKFKIPRAKRQLVAELKRLCTKATRLYIATDIGIIGEYIGWRITRALKLDLNKTKRLLFSSLTESSLKAAMQDESKSNFDPRQIQAFQARLICDRLVSFQISPLLSKSLGTDVLVNGRQAYLLGCLSRARGEGSASRFEIHLQFTHGLSSNFQKVFDTRTRGVSFLDRMCRSEFKVARDDGLSEKIRIKPFTTYSLIRHAHEELHADVPSVLQSAWRLYHFGKISFIMTDSTYIEENLVKQIRQEITDSVCPEEILQDVSDKPIEAIRVANPTVPELAGNIPFLDKLLYHIIWRNTVYSQLDDCITRTISLTCKETGDVECTTLLSPTLDKNHPLSRDSNSADDIRLLCMTAFETKEDTASMYDIASFNSRNDCAGAAFSFDNLDIPGCQNLLMSMSPTFKFEWNSPDKSCPVTCYPSSPNNSLTPLGEKACKFLETHFPKLVSDDFLKTIEHKFKDIEDGTDDWTEVADLVQKSIYPAINRLRKGKAVLEPRAVRHPRVLGLHPSTGEQIKVVKAKYGPCLMMGRGEKCVYFKITKSQYDTLCLNTAIPLLDRRRLLNSRSFI